MKISYDLVAGALDASDQDESVIYNNYSGRGMYGSMCFGLVLGGPRDLTRFFICLADLDQELALTLADDQRSDSMGFSIIYYFPGWEIGD